MKTQAKYSYRNPKVWCVQPPTERRPTLCNDLYNHDQYNPYNNPYNDPYDNDLYNDPHKHDPYNDPYDNLYDNPYNNSPDNSSDDNPSDDPCHDSYRTLYTNAYSEYNDLHDKKDINPSILALEAKFDLAIENFLAFLTMTPASSIPNFATVYEDHDNPENSNPDTPADTAANCDTNPNCCNHVDYHYPTYNAANSLHATMADCAHCLLLPAGYVLPVNHALQGHPEAPRLWEQHINSILTNKLQFRPTTHEPCLYMKHDHKTSSTILFLRQVDDFAVAASTMIQARQIIKDIGDNLIVPLNDLGQIQKFNGVNILQTKHYIKVSCDDYLQKILAQHDWTNLPASLKPVPMQSNSQFQSQLEAPIPPLDPTQQNTYQTQAGFSYRAAIGELIYALITARPDISYSTTKLAQYSANPQPVHYTAVKHVFAYLNMTKTHGLIFKRHTPRHDLPDIDPEQPMSNMDHRTLTTPITIPPLMAYTDSDWGSDRTHRRSVTGTLILHSGATVLYKTRYQPAIALSSTEAEFVAASDTGKSILYLRSLLSELGFPLTFPTPLLVDNRGALYMVESQAPTKRTRHVDIRYFALLQWQQQKLLTVIPVPTANNISDSLTKATGRIKFHQHTDIYMGRSRPLLDRSAAQRSTVSHLAFNHSSFSSFPTTHYTEVDSTGG